MTDQTTAKTCGTPCPREDHDHTCARSPGHLGDHRDVKQKGQQTCDWDQIVPPATYTQAEIREFAARAIREHAALGPLDASVATYEVSMGLMGEPDCPDLTDELLARIVAEIATATVTLSGLAAKQAPAVAVGWPTDPE
ncbi:hypothetical protein ACFRCG_39695 [Embleya sp. NPDC056575]|uniref:hypothetical protein n=1 Tax=unclassified Embleya TaxID=2699296 RepID=UPI0036BFA21D